MGLIKSIFYIILSLFILIFCLLNRQSVNLSFFGFNLELPLFVLFILTLVAGIIIGRVSCLFKELELKLKLSRLQSKIDLYEKQSPQHEGLEL